MLCLGKIHEHPHSIKHWEGKVELFMKSREYRELIGIDGAPVELEWNIFPGHLTLGLVREIQKKMTEITIRPEQFRDRIIFMSMYNDTDWTKDGKPQMCMSNSFEVKAHANRFPKGHWSFLGPGTEEKWYGTHTYKPEGLWNRSADMMILHLRDIGHPIFEQHVLWTEDF